ncbi:MAG: 50S ribosomal protein L11 methyltransferase [Cardiobacteriaceae bacterium]|nr:50S ribosomal protein L11 methyltransferase [Cardiobacteriaceae bacterium]
MTAQWLELTLIAHDEHDAECIEAALLAAGAIAITYTASDDEEIFEPPLGSMPLWAHTGVTGLFAQDSDPESVQFLLQTALGNDYPLTQRLFADSEWTRAWLDYFQPISFGNRFWVAASEHIIPETDAIILRLDPGLAFGTGTHPSTAMCLDWLVHHAALKNQTVYDYGCGSGILGIAAALLGAQHVWQTDIDPQALTASRDNAEKNQVATRITICPNPDDAPNVDLIIANILLEPLCALRPQFEKHLQANTALLFAGLLERQEERIHAVYADRYHITRANSQDGWILLHLSSKA